MVLKNVLPQDIYFSDIMDCIIKGNDSYLFNIWRYKNNAYSQSMKICKLRKHFNSKCFVTVDMSQMNKDIDI